MLSRSSRSTQMEGALTTAAQRELLRHIEAHCGLTAVSTVG